MVLWGIPSFVSHLLEKRKLQMQLLVLFSYQLQQNISEDEAPTKLVYPNET